VPTVLGHAAAALALGAAFHRDGWPKRAYAIGALCAVLPDLDVVGLRLGIPYGSLLGHRGLSHALLAAGLLGGLALALCFPRRERSARLAVYLVLAAASHGLLDAMTTGGMGIAFFAPFEDSRRFLPWRPIRVSPLALSMAHLARFLAVLASEAKWIGIPGLFLALSAWVARRASLGVQRS